MGRLVVIVTKKNVLQYYNINIKKGSTADKLRRSIFIKINWKINITLLIGTKNMKSYEKFKRARE